MLKTTRPLRAIAVTLLMCALLPVAAFANGNPNTIELTPIGSFASGGLGAAEISACDTKSKRLFVVNAAASAIDVLDLSNPKQPMKLFSIDVKPYGQSANSVAVRDGLVAVAVEANPKTDNGKAVFFDVDGKFINAVTVGALPDMLTFTPNGKKVLVANEGEPNDDYSVDPPGSVSIIDLKGGAKNLSQANVKHATFESFNNSGSLDPSIRIFGVKKSGQKSTIAEDLEPEYIAVSHDSKKAWVTCQENNAIAVLDIEAGVFTDLFGLGFKDHNELGNALDASDRDNAINITNWPVKGMYQPDGIVAFFHKGQTFLITANEGDARVWGAFNEESRVNSLTLDPTKFPNAATLKQNANLGRLTVTNKTGDWDGDGDFDELFVFGARSVTIWTAFGTQVWDSGDQLERITAEALPAEFNSSNSSNAPADRFDNRSDNKGPEPEDVKVAQLWGRTFAFVGLERIGGVVVFDISDPYKPEFVQYINTRTFAGANDDLGPEGLLVIEADDSPHKTPLLVVCNEISGTVRIFEIRKKIDLQGKGKK